MTKGIIALLMIWVYLVFKALQNPWVGVVGYAGFAVLCPPWNWRWGLPALEYQKFLAGATLLGWLMIGLQRQRLTRAVFWVLVASFVYVCLAWISSKQSLNPFKSAMYVDITFKIFLMFSVGIFLLRQSKHITILAWALMICQGWNALSINQIYFERGYIIINNFSWNWLDNNTYSISSLPILAMTFAILMTATKNWQRLLSGFILVLQLHQLMILQSRGTMLGAILLIVLGVFFMPKNRATWTMVSISFTLGAMLAGPSVIEEFNSSFKPKDQLDSSAQGRFYLWKAGAAIMNDYPLLGVGPWAGELLVPKYYEGISDGMPAKALHNLYFEVGTGCGMPALIAYLGIFIIPTSIHFLLWLRLRNRMPDWFRLVNLAVLCGIPGYWGASMFSSGALIEAPYLLVLLGCAALPVYRDELEQAELSPETVEEADDVPENAESSLAGSKRG